MRILPHNNSDICNYRQTVFFINQGISGASKHYVWDELSLLIYTCMLSDRHSHSIVVLWYVRPMVLIR